MKFDMEKALAGRPFTWNDMHQTEACPEIDLLFIVGKSKTDTYKKGTFIVQARALPGDSDDDLLLMSKKQLKKNCRMVDDHELCVMFNHEILANYSIQ